MPSLQTLLALLLPTAAFLPSVSAGAATFINKTPNAIYFSVVNEQKTVRTGKLASGASTDISYGNVDDGVSLKVGPKPALANPYQFEFTLHSDGLVYYDLSAEDGDPYLQYTRTVVPINAPDSCKLIKCEPGKEGCAFRKGNPAKPVYACSKEKDLHFIIHD